MSGCVCGIIAVFEKYQVTIYKFLGFDWAGWESIGVMWSLTLNCAVRAGVRSIRWGLRVVLPSVGMQLALPLC